MQAELPKYCPKNKEELKSIIIEIWNKIPIEFKRKIINRIFKHFCKDFNVRGDHFNY